MQTSSRSIPLSPCRAAAASIALAIGLRHAAQCVDIETDRTRTEATHDRACDGAPPADFDNAA